MFRQEEVYIGGWQEKTIGEMQRRRFEKAVAQLQPLGAARLEEMPPAMFMRRIEQSWQDIERKPMRGQQMRQVVKAVLDSVERHADCLSRDEHDLVERALILGGSAQIEDISELEAARALSMRLWASVGLVSGRPHIELISPVIRPAAKAFARKMHADIRRRFDWADGCLSQALYRAGALDDRQPQRMILREVLQADMCDELTMQLARKYLWASYDCVDYSGGVMLVHSALADPHHLIALSRRRCASLTECSGQGVMEILPEEIPLQTMLERAISGAVRDGMHAQDVARSLRFLCKQGAPLAALEEVLQNTLIVCISPAMRCALVQMYLRMPKWIECAEMTAVQ